MLYKRLFLASDIRHSIVNVFNDIKNIHDIISKHNDVIMFILGKHRGKGIAITGSGISPEGNLYVSAHGFGNIHFIPETDRKNGVEIVILYK